jgi:hypothetical protein
LHGHGRCEDDVVREVVQHLIEIVGEVAMAVGIAVLGPRLPGRPGPRTSSARARINVL